MYSMLVLYCEGLEQRAVSHTPTQKNHKGSYSYRQLESLCSQSREAFFLPQVLSRSCTRAEIEKRTVDWQW